MTTWPDICNIIFSRWWQLKHFWNVHPQLGKWSNLTSIFFKWVETTNALKPPAILIDSGIFFEAWNLQNREKHMACRHIYIYIYVYVVYTIYSMYIIYISINIYIYFDTEIRHEDISVNTMIISSSVAGWACRQAQQNMWQGWFWRWWRWKSHVTLGSRYPPFCNWGEPVWMINTYF